MDADDTTPATGQVSSGSDHDRLSLTRRAALASTAITVAPAAAGTGEPAPQRLNEVDDRLARTEWTAPGAAVRVSGLAGSANVRVGLAAYDPATTGGEATVTVWVEAGFVDVSVTADDDETRGRGGVGWTASTARWLARRLREWDSREWRGETAAPDKTAAVTGEVSGGGMVARDESRTPARASVIYAPETETPDGTARPAHAAVVATDAEREHAGPPTATQWVVGYDERERVAAILDEAATLAAGWSE